ncbi:MAG: hypothetical protein KatS3mg054_0047 [Chloroflexus sp.]|nr:MAG: hypothetical protein KatS3mg054_0047 [Chloroflexus sp.]
MSSQPIQTQHTEYSRGPRPLATYVHTHDVASLTGSEHVVVDIEKVWGAKGVEDWTHNPKKATCGCTAYDMKGSQLHVNISYTPALVSRYKAIGGKTVTISVRSEEKDYMISIHLRFL